MPADISNNIECEHNPTGQSEESKLSPIIQQENINKDNPFGYRRDERSVQIRLLIDVLRQNTDQRRPHYRQAVFAGTLLFRKRREAPPMVSLKLLDDVCVGGVPLDGVDALQGAGLGPFNIYKK